MRLPPAPPLAPVTPKSQAQVFGTLAATGCLMLLLWAPRLLPGEVTPPSMQLSRFKVAVLSGVKQAAQESPKDAVTVVEAAQDGGAVTAAPTTVDRDTRLPEAVSAAKDSSPGESAPVAEEVIPPARVSMPGGRLVVEDVGAGDHPDPFAIGKQQVYLRIYLTKEGKVVRGAIVRSGGEPLRDRMILKAIASREYSTENLKISSPDGYLQLDLVIDYGNNEYLP